MVPGALNRPLKTGIFIARSALGKVGDYVECQKCKGTFVERVLNTRPGIQSNEQFLSEYQKAVKKVLMKMVLADGTVDDKEKEMLAEILKKVSNIELTPEQMDKELDEVKSESRSASDYLSEVSNYLNDNHKELIIKAGFMIAAADGDVDKSEVDLINEFGVSMGMSKHHVNAVVSELLQKN